MIRRLICRYRGHKLERTPIRRARMQGIAVGCTRCDTLLGIESDPVPAMAVPRGR